MVDTTIENQDHTECAVQKGGFFGIIREFFHGLLNIIKTYLIEYKEAQHEENTAQNSDDHITPNHNNEHADQHTHKEEPPYEDNTPDYYVS